MYAWVFLSSEYSATIISKALWGVFMMFETFKSGVKSVNGVEISFVTAGKGPPVLLLHGFPQCKALWAKVAPLLSKDYTVVCADLRGYGDSSKPANRPDNMPYSFREMARDQTELMMSLGYDRFHVVGHDRGGRVSHRMAKDFPNKVLSLTVMDIVPTLYLYDNTNQLSASTYWHWYFLIQPAPFPETLINGDPDHFFETCLVGWGAASLVDFDASQVAAYRATWHDTDAVHAACNDYRAAATIDLEHDRADYKTKVQCPTLVMYGATGAMGKMFDVPQTWKDQLAQMNSCPIEGGHFFIDEKPDEVARALKEFLG